MRGFFHIKDWGWKKKILVSILVVLLLAIGAVFWKADNVLNKISGGKSNIFKSIVRSIPGVKNELKGESEGRINVALLGMRGEKVDGGGLLADTIMILSIKPAEKKVSLVSVPRDLYVTVPETDSRQKINAVYYYGEEKGKGQGMENMKKILSEISGLPIDYAVAVNFAGFESLVNAIGGIDITLDAPFMESQQFHDPHICDSAVFTVPALNEKGQQIYECKYSKKPRSSMKEIIPTGDPYPLCANKPEAKVGIFKVMAQYPLCYNNNEECGGVFKLEAGTNHLDGETALCYARSRYGTTDFDRAKRQQEIIKIVKQKLVSAGTLTDFTKINALFDSLGENVRTDMDGWEMKRFFDLYQEIGDAAIVQKVLEDSDDGLLYHPEESSPEAGYILLPRGDNYDHIKEMFANII